MGNQRMPNSDLFGYERRQQALKSARKIDNRHAMKVSQEICESEWHNFLDDLKFERTEGYRIQVTDELIDKLYDRILKQFNEQLKATQIPAAMAHRLKFFNNINKKRSQKNLKPFPTPVIADIPKRPANTNDLDNFLYLETAEQIVNNALQIWQAKNSFTLLDSVTWLLFSQIVFGGYNEAVIIKAVYQALKDKTTIYHVGKEQLLIPIELTSTEYANRIVRLDKDNPDEVQLYYSRWVFLNDVSRLWLVYFNTHFTTSSKFPSYAECIRRLSELVGEKFNADNFANSRFLTHINIFWQTLPNVKIDQQMVETLVGRQRHTAITFEQLLRYFSPIKIDSRTKASLATNSNERAIAIDQLITSKSSANIPILEGDFKDDIVKVIRNILNGQKSQILSQLERFYAESPLLPSQQRLVRWLIDLTKRGNKPSTLRRYLSEIGNDFLAETRDADFIGWQDFEYKFIYDKIVSTKNTLKMGYTRTVLASLHDVLVREFNAPYLRLNGEKDPLVVNSCLIPVALYQHMLTQVENHPSINDKLRDVLKLILILLYRTGMRFMEVLSIRLSDIEYDNQGFINYNIVLRPHAQRDLKSDDATRRFMLNVLLQPTELAAFTNYFHQKLQQNAQYLFTLPHHAQPIDRNSVELPFREILTDPILQNRYHDISMHSFRHNAISNMALILRCDYSVIEHFTDYSREQVKVIRQSALGTKRKVSPSFWQVLEDFAGHADLNTTFSSYIHTADIIAHHQLSKAKIQLPLATVIKLSGKARRNLNQYHKDAVDFDNEVVNLWHIRSFINNTLATQKLAHNAKINVKTDEVLTTNADLLENTPQSSIFGKYNRLVIEKMLSDIESGMDLSSACQLNIDFNDAMLIYQNALKLITNEDGSSNYKFVSQKRQQISSHPIITPTPLHYHQEIALANLCFDNIEKLCQSKAGKRELAEFVKTFYEKTLPSKPEIRFPFKEIKQFYGYLETALKILPSEYWRINICKYTPTTVIDEVTGEKSFSISIDKKETGHAIKKFNEKFADFKGDITQKSVYSGFSLSMIRPNDKGKPTKKQPNSVMIKHIVHWLLIMGWEKN